MKTDEEKIVRVTRLPVVRCEICKKTMAHRPGQVKEVLSAHYREKHPDVTGDLEMQKRFKPDSRRILALRTLMIAWTHMPDASLYALFCEALQVGAQYEPQIRVKELASLWPWMSDLLGPLPQRLPPDPEEN